MTPRDIEGLLGMLFFTGLVALALLAWWIR